MKLHENVLRNSFLLVGLGAFLVVGVVVTLTFREEIDNSLNHLMKLAIENPLISLPTLMVLCISICLKLSR